MLKRFSTPIPLILLIISFSCCWGQTDSEFNRLKEVIGLSKGQSAADLGAGDGEWSALIVGEIGEKGRVWVTEVDSEKVSELEEKFQDSPNVEVVLGEQSRSGLPADCCDTILIRLVYHHFEEPSVILSDLEEALKKGGKIVVIDFTPDNHLTRSNVPGFRDGHGVMPETVITEMNSSGFELVDRIEPWFDDDRFLLLFQESGTSQ